MTPTTKAIFENYEVRKSKKQKTAFIDWVKPILEREGYAVTVEKGSFGVRNIVIGDVDKAKVVYTAHYDTCAVMPIPNFITPKSIPIYILYNILVTALLFGVAGLITGITAFVSPELAPMAWSFSCLGLCVLLMAGPANKHTANDNTSGVTAVLDLAFALPKEQRENVAFVLFDLEEAGLLGSSAFASKHKKAMKDKLLVNLDCVSDGETMLFVLRKKVKKLLPLFRQAFPSDYRITTDFATKGYIYPSDQANFPVGVGVATLLKTKSGLLYMDKIHTPKDTVYREENIAYLVEGCIRLADLIVSQ